MWPKKSIWSGSVSLSACCEKRLSLTINPARNAPSERLTPARLVKYAVPKQMAITVKRNNSGEHVKATDSRIFGITRLATTSTSSIMPMAVPSAVAICPSPPSLPPASTGTRSTITTIARS